MCIEALMAKHSPRGRAVKCKIPVVYSRSFVASGSAVRISNPSEGHVKPNVNPVGGANASRTNVKKVIDKDKHVKQFFFFTASHAHVSPNCDNINDWQGSEDIVSPTGQSVTMVKDSDRIWVIHAPDVSDPTAEVISAPGVVSETGQGFEGQNVAAKVISAPGTQGKSHSDHIVGSQCKQGNPSVEMVQSGLLPLYDVNYTGVEDKFVNSILHMHQFSTSGDIGVLDSEIYNAWRRQSDFRCRKVLSLLKSMTGLHLW